MIKQPKKLTTKITNQMTIRETSQGAIRGCHFNKTWLRLLFGPVLALVTCTAWAAGPSGLAEAELELSVSHEARSLQPGEVVLMRVSSRLPLKKIEAKAFGKIFPFFPDESPMAWSGLVGIDLDVAPKNYKVLLSATRQDGGGFQIDYDLAVKDKQFPTRRLTVKEGFVNPPAEQLERIRRESRQVAAIFATVSPDRFWSGTFLRPVPGAATSSFGKRSILNGQPRSPHSGTDFRAGEGTPIQAPNGGKVVLAAELYYSGNVVILDHGMGMYSYFAHLSRLAVSEGDEIATGGIVGYVGATGRVTGPHLHWTLRLSGARVDPLSLMEVLAGENDNE